MKKRLLSLLAMSITAIALFAQTNPERLLIRDISGNQKGYLVERIDSIYFVSEPTGRVAADVEFKSYTPDGPGGPELTVAVTRTADCAAYRIDVCPANMANLMGSDMAIIDYLERMTSTLYYEDFTSAAMSGFSFDFQSNTKYSILTVGYDKYGIACSVSRADFTTPRDAVTGNPQVKCTVSNVGTTSFDVSFEPNEDTGGYSYCLFGKGEAEEQLNGMGAMFGFGSIGEMVRGWGIEHTGNYSFTYTGQEPGKEYELYIQPWDVNGANADLQVVPITMQKLGGEGQATIEITIGEFGGDATDGYYQTVTYTPNDQTWLHRDIIIDRKAFETGDWGGDEAKIVEYLKTDNAMDPYWNQYGVDVAKWSATPATAYIAYSIAMNANGEWGPLARKEFSTPSVDSQAAPRRVRAAGGERQGVAERRTAAEGTPKIDLVRQLFKGVTVRQQPAGGLKISEK